MRYTVISWVGENSRIGGVLLAAELAVAVGRVDDLPGVTVDPRWKDFFFLVNKWKTLQLSLFDFFIFFYGYSSQNYLSGKMIKVKVIRLDFAQVHKQFSGKTAKKRDSVIKKRGGFESSKKRLKLVLFTCSSENKGAAKQQAAEQQATERKSVRNWCEEGDRAAHLVSALRPRVDSVSHSREQNDLKFQWNGSRRWQPAGLIGENTITILYFPPQWKKKSSVCTGGKEIDTATVFPNHSLRPQNGSTETKTLISTK